jgi:hypothetical protein
MLSSLSCHLISLLPSLLNVNSFRLYSTMGVKTRTSTTKEKPPKPTFTTKSLQPTCSSSKSPTATNDDSLLAKINLPQTQFEGVLTALSSPGSNIVNLDGPDNLLPLPLEMDTQNNQVEPTCRINKTPTPDPPNIIQATFAEKQAPSLILWHTGRQQWTREDVHS